MRRDLHRHGCRHRRRFRFRRIKGQHLDEGSRIGNELTLPWHTAWALGSNDVHGRVGRVVPLRVGGRHKGDEQDKEARHSTSKGRQRIGLGDLACWRLRAQGSAGKGRGASRGFSTLLLSPGKDEMSGQS